MFTESVQIELCHLQQWKYRQSRVVRHEESSPSVQILQEFTKLSRYDHSVFTAGFLCVCVDWYIFMSISQLCTEWQCLCVLMCIIMRVSVSLNSVWLLAGQNSERREEECSRSVICCLSSNHREKQQHLWWAGVCERENESCEMDKEDMEEKWNYVSAKQFLVFIGIFPYVVNVYRN